MKNNLFIFILFILTSCQNDVKFNEPAFQGLKNNTLWKANVTKAQLNKDGSLTIQALTNTEALVLTLNNMVIQNFVLGIDEKTKATYEQRGIQGQGVFETSMNVGNGNVNLTTYDAVQKTVSGNFKFNLINTVSKENLNFQKGVFYKVPLTIAK